MNCTESRLFIFQLILSPLPLIRFTPFLRIIYPICHHLAFCTLFTTSCYPPLPILSSPTFFSLLLGPDNQAPNRRNFTILGTQTLHSILHPMHLPSSLHDHSDQPLPLVHVPYNPPWPGYIHTHKSSLHQTCHSVLSLHPASNAPTRMSLAPRGAELLLIAF
jgi:hypothetical protein